MPFRIGPLCEPASLVGALLGIGLFMQLFSKAWTRRMEKKIEKDPNWLGKIMMTCLGIVWFALQLDLFCKGGYTWFSWTIAGLFLGLFLMNLMTEHKMFKKARSKADKQASASAMM